VLDVVLAVMIIDRKSFTLVLIERKNTSDIEFVFDRKIYCCGNLDWSHFLLL